MQVSKIFSSIEDTGLHVGYMTTYIRTFGCNLSCSYCDSDYCVSPDTPDGNFEAMDVEDIIEKVIEFGNIHITFTGGEPLLQQNAAELVATLLDSGYYVNVETQGGVDLAVFEAKMVGILADDELLNNLTYSIDYKCPSSDMAGRMLTENISFLVDNDVLKFFVSDEEDLEFVQDILEEYEPLAQIFVLPIGEMQAKTIVDFISSTGLQQARVQLPLRKTIYGEDMHV